ncbi:hypothetical protein AS149_37000 [Burkholderia cenocepacia]|nr:hypothetical protein AS149_37000 [Burkholderia cenocepacia]
MIAVYPDEAVAQRHADIATGQLEHIHNQPHLPSQWDVAQYLTFDPLHQLGEYRATYAVEKVPLVTALPGANGLHAWFGASAQPAQAGASRDALEGAMAQAFRRASRTRPTSR